ncbi:MAG TPA: zinc ribbon domain-containing protein [Candidatus Binataceae bacterium]|nr:zinc ribbon domain-containing protein [Candidatus Binataceae bacterium]
MPIYEYHCQDCDSSFETLVRPGHGEDAQCPKCSGGRINREMSVFASGHGGDGERLSPANGPSMARGGGCCGGSCGCN